VLGIIITGCAQEGRPQPEATTTPQDTSTTADSTNTTVVPVSEYLPGLEARFHLPAPADLVPLVVMVPGGGWSTADPAGFEGLARDLAILALTVPAGYGLARFPVPGKDVIFVFLLLALIIPYQALLTPVFLMFSTLGLTNNLLGLAIVHTTIQLPFSLYIMRNAFEAVPRELEEAAVVDGANSWQVLRRVFMPTMVPAVITVTLFAFVTSWNEFLGALVMLTRDSSLTLPLILAAARSVTSLGSTDWGMLQAGVTIAIIPCVLVYFLLQRYYVSGLLSGAVK
jgi:multiple sugar transport system permease protein